MKISKRLEFLASLVDKNAKVYDIGCDHGLLSIYLSLNNHNVVATDISNESIIKTKENIKKYNVENIDVILTDGLNGLNIKKDDNLIIAGMGTNTILRILATNILPDTLIIQSNNSHDILRKEVCKLGYYIDLEHIFKDERMYVIIRFKKGYKKYKKIDYILGFSNDYDYLNKIYKRYYKLYQDIPIRFIIRRFKTKLIIKSISKKIKSL